jgi:hypothetical protein
MRACATLSRLLSKHVSSSGTKTARTAVHTFAGHRVRSILVAQTGAKRRRIRDGGVSEATSRHTRSTRNGGIVANRRQRNIEIGRGGHDIGGATAPAIDMSLRRRDS